LLSFFSLKTESLSPSAFPVTSKPTRFPTFPPTTTKPTIPFPTSQPSKQPFSHPTCQPTGSPSSSSPSSDPTMKTDSPTPVRPPSITAYPSQTRKPTRTPTFRPSFLPTAAPSQTISVVPGNINFKESLFFLGSYLPVVGESVPNIDLTTESAIGSSYIVFGYKDTAERRRKEIIIGTRESQGLYSPIRSKEGGTGGGLLQDRSMSRVALPVGDLNDDSWEDLIICDPMNSVCFVYFGHANGFQNLQVSFSIRSTSNDLFGWSVGKLNDINGDKINFAISALSSNMIFLFFGSSLLLNEIVVDAERDFSEGIKVIGSQFDETSGLALSSAGDFNSDGHSDLLFSAIQLSPYQNVIYILFLTPAIMKKKVFVIDNLLLNKDYYKIIAPLFSFAGFSLSNLGDINQDGFDDVIIGSVPYSGRHLTQKSYVLFGRNMSLLSSVRTFDLLQLSEEDGIIITGGGFMVGGPGDLNGDGIPDIMISSYQQWQGQGNSFIMVFPRNITCPPTFLPSSQPTSGPSSSPSVSPSNKIIQPTSNPTLASSSPTPEPGTFPPFLPRTENPTLAPRTTKPSRSPTFRPSTGLPTVTPSLSPTRSPTIKPTLSPTKKPTLLPSSQVPSRIPTRRPSNTKVPTASPSNSSSPVESDSTDSFEVITIDSPGSYNVSSGQLNYVIGGKGSIVILGGDKSEDKDDRKIFTILPDRNIITITDFDEKKDRISLVHFPELQTVGDLPYRCPPLQFILSSQQQIILISHDELDLTEENFIFREDHSSSSKKQSPLQKDLSFIVSLVVLFGGLSFTGLCIVLAKYNNSKEDNRLEKALVNEDNRGVDPKTTGNDVVAVDEEDDVELGSLFSSLDSSDDDDEDNGADEEEEDDGSNWMNLFFGRDLDLDSEDDVSDLQEENYFSSVDPRLLESQESEMGHDETEIEIDNFKEDENDLEEDVVFLQQLLSGIPFSIPHDREKDGDDGESSDERHSSPDGNREAAAI
jgi:hypothetical protein